MTKFMFTMNMPSGNGNLVHQVIGEHPANSCEELLEDIDNKEYIIIRQYYYVTDPETGKQDWQDRVDMIINTYHIGKVQIHIMRGDRR